METIAFFNNKGGVGKTTLVFHLAWMLSSMGRRVIVADLDPQANLTNMFLSEQDVEALSSKDTGNGFEATIFGALRPILEGTGDVHSPHVVEIANGLGLIPGDLALSLSEDELNSQWPQCLNRNPRAYRVMSAFHRAILRAGETMSADIALIDVGPNLGALNRAALIAADHVVIPLAPDLFSLKGLENLGTRLSEWRADWRDRCLRNPLKDFELPRGAMRPAGYIVMKHSERLDKPVKAYDYWMGRIPGVYASSVLRRDCQQGLTVEHDANCLARVKDYRSLMPIAHRLHKPVFNLKPADSVFGANARGVKEAGEDFRSLATLLLNRVAGPKVREFTQFAEAGGFPR